MLFPLMMFCNPRTNGWEWEQVTDLHLATSVGSKGKGNWREYDQSSWTAHILTCQSAVDLRDIVAIFFWRIVIVTEVLALHPSCWCLASACSTMEHGMYLWSLHRYWWLLKLSCTFNSSVLIAFGPWKTHQLYALFFIWFWRINTEG